MHLDGRPQGGMQLRWWFGILFGVLVNFRKIDGWVSCGVLFGMLFRGMVQAHFCSIDGRVCLGRSLGGVLLEVLVCKRCYLGSMLVYFFLNEGRALCSACHSELRVSAFSPQISTEPTQLRSWRPSWASCVASRSSRRARELSAGVG